ncbi:HAD-IIB family hydrolase [Vibrio aquaticus]|uniref:HAD-IIB family hydrolase n=1 Tax=Vibrio aquaticus TaxID=2496559 RepID=A0A3S0MMH3_9VIBR|nr:HAD-IIB family hydrolase [Vibrio aquaticus]RTZ17972.1 HAD-IIB family hydrolase [Vibrio aquaticus]
MEHGLSKDWKQIEWVLTDVDDTLTWQGKLPPETLIALNALKQQGIKVVAVTGACAGWCDHIAQLWPVDAVLGENGAFTLEKGDRGISLASSVPLETMRAQQAELKVQIKQLLAQYPDVNLTLDQAYRLCEVAIDIGQNREPLDPRVIEQLVAQIHQLGAHATASSIHINAWYGEHSKRNSTFAYLKRKGLSEQEILEKCCYVGDSLNDQQMFETLPMTVGVKNIEHYWHKLSHKPSLVMSQPGGFGFAEFSQQLLALKEFN